MFTVDRYVIPPFHMIRGLDYIELEGADEGMSPVDAAHWLHAHRDMPLLDALSYVLRMRRDAEDLLPPL